MLLDFTFDAETHTYRVPGLYVLATSDIISLCGLSDYSGIPKQVLDHASWRGTQCHRSIEFLETSVRQGETLQNAAASVWEQLVGDLAEIKPFLKGYLKFRQEYDFQPIGELERQMVYMHDGVEQAIGVTIDLRGLVDGIPYILDTKTTSKQYGMAKAQKLLAWRCQTASYACATDHDQEWHELQGTGEAPRRGIIQVNKEGGFDFHDFGKTDDTLLWDGMVRLAMAKLSSGFKLKERE